jgi:hypothetical protein
MVTCTTANSTTDLEGIFALQKTNLAKNLSQEEIQSQGFVTVDHSYDQLRKLNDIEKHVIAKDNDKVVAYVLAMTKKSGNDIPILIPMFEAFDKIVFKGKPVNRWKYIVVGQVCVDKAYRGTGVFDQCYAEYKKAYGKKYDFVITEIAASNTRSLQAHKRIGFKEIDSYLAPDKTQWIVVVWEWL